MEELHRLIMPLRQVVLRPATGPSLIMPSSSSRPLKTVSKTRVLNLLSSTRTIIDAKSTVVGVLPIEIVGEAAITATIATQMTSETIKSSEDARAAETTRDAPPRTIGGGGAGAEVATRASRRRTNSSWSLNNTRRRSGKRHCNATWRKRKGKLRRPSATTVRCW